MARLYWATLSPGSSVTLRPASDSNSHPAAATTHKISNIDMREWRRAK
jgi:hypothetical protein